MTYKYSTVFLANNADYANGRNIVLNAGFDIGEGVPVAEESHRYGHAWINDPILTVLSSNVTSAFESANLNIIISISQELNPRDHVQNVLANNNLTIKTGNI